jgi:phosphatase NudJ
MGRRFLLVQEAKHGGGWYLPAGRVEPGETFFDGAVRETKEESGLDVTLEGLVRVEHTPFPEGYSRLRIIFVARPVNDAQPKSFADEHSVRAAWFTLEEIEKLPLRGDEVLELFRFISNGGAIYPIKLLSVREVPF